MKRIPISAAKDMAARFGLRQVVLMGYDGKDVFITTYGVTKEDCRQAAIAQDWWQGRVFSSKSNAVTE